MPLNILQISDCHLVAAGQTLLGVDTEASLRAVLRQALSERTADAVIATGDLAHEATVEVYRRWLQIVREASSVPLLCLPGNHDVLAPMMQAGLPMAALQVGNWALIPLDSHEDDAPRARIDERDRQAVAAAFDALPASYCVVATHHPMVSINCPWLDRDRIQNGSELIEWLAGRSAVDGTGKANTSHGHSRLRSVVFGHAHQIVEQACAGLPVYGVPSTCFQFAPNSRTFSLDQSAPGYRWLELYEDGSMSTRVERVTSFPIDPKV